MSAFWQLTLLRLREFFREPASLFWVFGFPILLAIALGLAFQSDVEPGQPVVVLPGPQQAQRTAALEASRGLIVRQAEREEAFRLLRKGEAYLIVGGDESLRYIFDPTRPEAQGLRLKVDNVLQQAAGRTDVLETEDEPVKVPGSRYIDFLIPGLLGMNIMGASMWGIGWVIVQTRTRKLLKRLMATPMRKRDYLLSHVAARLVFLVLEVAVILGFAHAAFDVAVQGSIAAVALLSLSGALCFGGIGLLVASRARTAETVSGLMNAVMFPMWLLSGVFFSAANFPEWMQPAIQLLPLTALNDAFRVVMNEGGGLVSALLPSAFLLLWGAAAFGLALKIFRWQ